MLKENLLSVERVAKEMVVAFDGVGTMKWDDRFDAVLIEFSSARKKDVRLILTRFFSHTWDDDNIVGVKGIVSEINEFFGGLRSDQFIFTTDPEVDLIFFCAWWPWGDGSIVSIRFAPYFKSLSDKEMIKINNQFKTAFNLI